MTRLDTAELRRQADNWHPRWRATVLALLDAYDREQWRPIETAPKEHGKDVLLFGVQAPAQPRHTPQVFIGCWRAREELTGVIYRPPEQGWWRATPNIGEVLPTHWMPLPPAPTTTPEEK